MDKDILLSAIKHYKFQADPHNPDNSDLATVKDIRRVIEQTAELITPPIEQLDD